MKFFTATEVAALTAGAAIFLGGAEVWADSTRQGRRIRRYRIVYLVCQLLIAQDGEGSPAL